MPAPNSNLYGMRLIGDRHLTMTVEVSHDRSRFIEYGPEDYSWRRYFGFLTLEQRPSEKVYRIGDTWVMHPDLIERIKKSDRLVFDGAGNVVGVKGTTGGN